MILRLPGTIQVAAALLVLTMAAGHYVDLRTDEMHVRHRAVSTALERISRLNLDLGAMLMVSVLERNTLRSASYDSVQAELDQTFASVAQLTQDLALAAEITALQYERRALQATEREALKHMRADQWPEARAILTDDRHVLARKIYEINSETAIGALNGELAAAAQSFEVARKISLAARLGALLLLLWAGASFSRRQRAELVAQERLRAEISAANQQLEAKVRERTLALEEANQRLAALSVTDGLTGLANRRRLDEVLASEWQRAQRQSLPLAVAMIDVDEFKAYNDHHGHQAGDDCLRRVARVLMATVQRSGEVVARYGGEEFVAVLPGLELRGAEALAERIRQGVEAEAITRQAASGRTVVTVSIGVASIVPRSGEAAEMLVQSADAAVYEAKRQGRNKVVAANAATMPGPS